MFDRAIQVVKAYTKIYFFAAYLNLAALINPPLILRPGNFLLISLNVDIFLHVASMLHIKYVVKDKKHLDLHKPCVIIMNHQSILDMLIILKLIKMVKRGAAIVGTNRFTFSPFGIWQWLSTFYFLPLKSNIHKAKSVLNKAAAEAKKNNMKLVICPEGRVNNNGKISSFKKGAFYMAIKAKLPIVPVVCSRYYFFNSSAKHFDRGTIYIKCLPLIKTEHLTEADVTDLIEQTRSAMQTVFEELTIHDAQDNI